MGRRLQNLPHWVRSMWPHVAVAFLVLVSGIVNLVAGVRSFRLVPAQQIDAFGRLGGTLPALGHSAESILGGALVMIGLGLFWRLQSAWAFALCITALMIAVDVAVRRWGTALVIPAIIFVGLIAARKSFRRRTVFAAYLVSVVGILGVLTFGSVGAYVLGEGFSPRIGSLSDGFFYTITTLATVGSVFQPTTFETKMFEIALIVIGVGVFTSTIISAFGPAISDEMNRIFKPGDTVMDLRDHVILLGDNAIAANTADELSRRGVAFVRVVPSGEVNDAGEDRIIHGAGTDRDVLLKAGVDRARLIVASLDSDQANAMATLFAKHLNPKIRALAIAADAASGDPLRLAGADVVFSPAAVGSRLLANLVEGTPLTTELTALLQ